MAYVSFVFVLAVVFFGGVIVSLISEAIEEMLLDSRETTLERYGEKG